MERTGTGPERERQSRSSRDEQRESSTAGSPRTAVGALHGSVGNQAVKDLHERGELQPKLSVTDPGDGAEREAERVADAVVASSSPDQGRATGLDVRRTSETGGLTAPGDAERQIRSLQGGGAPLPASTRSYFEERMGADFSDVRVHTGQRADVAAHSIDAEAFTIGRDVVFRSGAYRPSTRGGKRLLAHELTHVLQQGDGLARLRGDTVRRQEADSGESQAVRDHPLGDKIAGHLATHDEFVDRMQAGVDALAEDESGGSTADLLRLMMQSSQRWEKRYLLANAPGLAASTGVLDLKHFLWSAGEAYSGIASQILFEDEEERAPSYRRAYWMGVAQELDQLKTLHGSAFSAEDVPSNDLGARFGQLLAESNADPGDVPGELDDFLDRMNTVDPDEIDQLNVGAARDEGDGRGDWDEKTRRYNPPAGFHDPPAGTTR